jgi:exopolysaccharide biosynthesis polyprenyl glycosylphosphotransferase
MMRSVLKKMSLITGDAALLALSLGVAIIVRGRSSITEEWQTGGLGWLVVLIGWLLLTWLSGLYSAHRLRNDITFIQTFIATTLTNMVTAMLFFYLIPLGIAPKTTLLILTLIYTVAGLVWRRGYNRWIAGPEAAEKTVLMGNGPGATHIAQACADNTHHGYTITQWIKETPTADAVQAIPADTQVLIIPRAAAFDTHLAPRIYNLLAQRVRVRTIDEVYSELFGRIPLDQVDETWLLQNVVKRDDLSREFTAVVTYTCAALLQILLLPLDLIIALAIGATSKGPVIYTQKRISQDGRPFTLYKFRTMHVNAEQAGPQWSSPQDSRVTLVGRVLRYTHLDELPQLINILKGELAFVGPRPERPEFEALLTEQIPHYRVRHLIKPGVTGWAQVSYRYGSTIEHAKDKLEYDLHYLKNRSIIMDLVVIAKTVKTLIYTPR